MEPVMFLIASLFAGNQIIAYYYRASRPQKNGVKKIPEGAVFMRSLKVAGAV